MADTQETKKKPSIVIKKVIKGKVPHHGGAWKVAYADFVTAMMAFFLLMWLLNVTSMEQKKGIANYFSPVTQNNAIPSQRDITLEKVDVQTFEPLDETELETDNQETRGPEETATDKIISADGRKKSTVEKDGKTPDKKLSKNNKEMGVNSPTVANKIEAPDSSGVTKKEEHPTRNMQHSMPSDIIKKVVEKKNKKEKPVIALDGQDKMKIKAPLPEKSQAEKMLELKKEQQRLADIKAYEEEKKKFDNIAKSLKQAIQDIPELKEVAKNLIIEMTEEGMRIQIVDELKKPMFASGSAVMHGYTRKLLERVSKSISTVPNKISISGHTDSVPYKSTTGYSNWELSSDRAHASRRLLIGSGIDPKRIVSVIGKEDKEPIFPDNPMSPENRRISLMVLFDKKAPVDQKPTPQEGSVSTPSGVLPIPPVPTTVTSPPAASVVVPPKLDPVAQPKEGSIVHNSSSA